MKQIPRAIKWKKAFIKELIASLDAGVSVNGLSMPCREGQKGVLKVSSVSYGIFNPLENKEIISEELPRAKETPQEDRIIISRSSGSKALVGANVYINKNYDYLFLSDKLWQLKPQKNLSFSMKWLFYYLNTPRIKSLMKDLSTGSSTMHNLSKEDFFNFPVDIPPFSEQIKIAEIISTWDKAITQTQQLIEAKQQLKQGLMQQLLMGRMRFNGFVTTNDIKASHFYSFPTDWENPKIAEFATEVSERNSAGSEMTVLSCSKYSGFVNSLEYFGKQVFSDDRSNYKVIHRNQFGFPANHVEEGSIGLLKHVEKGIVSPIYIIFEVDKKKVNPDYLFLILKSETYKHIFSSRTSASVDRRGSLRWDEFSSIRFPLPSLAEQARIVSLFESCNRVITGYEAKKAILIKQKQGLMQKLLTGLIRVITREVI